MSERTNTFDLKLLTTSKEVGLRRLRSYCASLGGGAQIFNSYEDLRRSLETGEQSRDQNVVLHDHTLALSAVQLHELAKLARVFVLHRGEGATVPLEGAPCWDMESYLQCSLGVFLESQVIRMSMAQLCQRHQPFHVAHLLRWGHTAQIWNTGGVDSVADASYAFVKSLNLTGEGRRLTEMFSHLIQAGFGQLSLVEDQVTFGSDGTLILVSARCRPEPGLSMREVAAELRVHDFPIAIANRLPDGMLEVAALHYPYQAQSVQAERLLMVFNKTDAEAAELSQPLDRAG